MKFSPIYTLMLLTIVGLSSCKKKGCMDQTAINYDAAAEKDNGSCEYEFESTITLNFSQNIGGTEITTADFDQLNYTTPEGNVYSVTKLQYHISDVRFYKANGDSVMYDGYHFIDMEDASTMTYELSEKLDHGSYIGIGFNFGFDEEDNVDGAYNDLNQLSWSSPTMLGGGYHQMKFEGKYIDDNTDTIGFAYHSLSTIRKTTPDTTFHANYVNINLTKSMSINSATSIEIEMDLQEWFQNPNLWDLDTHFTMLMPNYDAQVMMRQNASSVFAVGTVE